MLKIWFDCEFEWNESSLCNSWQKSDSASFKRIRIRSNWLEIHKMGTRLNYSLMYDTLKNYRYISLLIRTSNENSIYPFLSFRLYKRALDSNISDHSGVVFFYLFFRIHNKYCIVNLFNGKNVVKTRAFVAWPKSNDEFCPIDKTRMRYVCMACALRWDSWCECGFGVFFLFHLLYVYIVVSLIQPPKSPALHSDRVKSSLCFFVGSVVGWVFISASV